MSIADRLVDAQLLQAQKRFDGALLNVLVAFAATSRRRYPKKVCKTDREAFTKFAADEMVVITAGNVQNYNVRVPGSDLKEYRDDDDLMPLGVCLYKFVRNNLAHEAEIAGNVEFTDAPEGILRVQIDDDAIRLSKSYIYGLARAVEFAPENADQFPDVARLPDDDVAGILFGERRDNLTDYVQARRERIDALRAAIAVSDSDGSEDNASAPG